MRWVLNNKVIFERWQLVRGVCRVYAIFMSGKSYQIKAATGFIIKLGNRKFVVSCLSVYLCDKESYSQRKFMENKPLMLASFGNVDFLECIEKFLCLYTGKFDQKKVEMELISRFYQVMTTLEINVSGLLARKEWLINNSRCCEVLESEFFYQLHPSLDMAMYEIDNLWLKEKQIKSIKFCKPDSRYMSMGTIGFSQPRILENSEWRKRYS